MKFHFVVMQYTGQVTDRGHHTSEKTRSTDIGQRLIQGFDLMLEEHQAQLLDGVAKAEFPFLDDQSGLFTWHQPEPFSATAAFFIAEKLKFTWFYLIGQHADSDRIVAGETVKFIQDMSAEADYKGPAPRLPTERPLALCVPWPPSPSEQHRAALSAITASASQRHFLTRDRSTCRSRES